MTGHVAAVFFWLMVGHAIADYLWQSLGVNHDKNPNKAPAMWIYAMTAHCLANAGAVALATGSVPRGGAEFVVHFVIDLARCDGRLSRPVDQGLHVACKALWAVLA
jgi:hypothetical protein